MKRAKQTTQERLRGARRKAKQERQRKNREGDRAKAFLEREKRGE